ncbi:MAG TPA: methyltransferase domain-containing protein [Thermoanaerobaculia bacterium]|nr:methyltransferase domain-containing protein [Thermoanaerobaculia bacterium]
MSARQPRKRASLKKFERLYLVAEPFLPPLHKIVRRYLLELAAEHSARPAILDVGGRKSHCTIGVDADITISDLPRETALENSLNLGINEHIRESILTRRSNVRNILYDDMTRSLLPTETFDAVVAVEVLEHVEDDESFVREVHRVLKPGGTFLMTTPNGDFVRNTNPDHKRHYTGSHLRARLGTSFAQFDVAYAIRAGRWRDFGLRSWSGGHPLRTALSMAGNVVNGWQSARVGRGESIGTRHLIAVARKS